MLFRSASQFLPHHNLPSGKGKGKGKELADDALGASSVLSCLSKWAAAKPEGEVLTVAVVGVTNVSSGILS
jgi:nuclear GTP-binding protein